MKIDDYIKRLYERMAENDDLEEDLESLKTLSGATDSDIKRLKEAYPECPQLLIDLLKRINGTYWRKTTDGNVAVAILASMDYEYPHYLLSVDQIIKGLNEDSIEDIYGSVLEDDDLVDEKINPKCDGKQWLHFTDCINNGGTSRLYIDFAPAQDGVKGQIVEYVHDPDQYKVIADSFEEYMSNIMEANYPFLDDY